ncbi:hypothetical protein ACFOKF_16380 [Sphingobium rhizovicinum]|uniref:Uncharacterized protein n=1 Tax=Sphingobium rhizovicinum TaxID=432308 RepID=A0ABV7NJ70_9SPHN
MAEIVYYPDGPPASHVEICSGVQHGPAKLTGARGTWLDVKDWGFMTFWVDVVDTEGNRLTIHDGRSYEQAIIEAEQAAQEWKVEVRDMVETK